METEGTKKGIGNGQNNEEKFLGIQSMLKAQSDGNARQWGFFLWLVQSSSEFSVTRTMPRTCGFLLVPSISVLQHHLIALVHKLTDLGRSALYRQLRKETERLKWMKDTLASIKYRFQFRKNVKIWRFECMLGKLRHSKVEKKVKETRKHW